MMQEKKTTTPTRKDNIQGRNDTRISTLGRAPQRFNCCAGQSTEVCGKFVLEVSARVLGGRSVSRWRALASSKVCGKSRAGRAFGPTWIRWIVCVFAHSVQGMECARHVRAAWRALFFFLIQKEPATVPVGETIQSLPQCRHPYTSLFSTTVLKKCVRSSPCT